MKMKYVLGLSILILMLTNTNQIDALSVSDSDLASEGSTYSITVSIDSRVAKNESSFSVTVGLTADAFAPTVSRFYSIVLYARIKSVMNESYELLDNTAVNPISSEGQMQEAEFNFVIEDTIGGYYVVYGRADFNEDESEILDSKTIVPWLMAFPNVSVEAHFSGLLIIGSGFIILIIVPRIFRRKKRK